MPVFLFYESPEDNEIFYGQVRNVEERSSGKERVSRVYIENNSENQ